MAKTRAEIQRKYRENKKAKEGHKYLEKESKRRMRYYVPVGQINRREKEKRNEKNRAAVQRYRQRKREMMKQINAEQMQAQMDLDTSGYDSVEPSTSENSGMVVRLDFPNPRRSGTRKRISRALTKAHKELQALKIKNLMLQRKYRTIQRRIQRKSNSNLKAPKSPRSKAERDMTEMGLSDTHKVRVRRQLCLGHALIHEIQEARKEVKGSKSKVRSLHSIISGKIIKKYRGMKWLSSQTGMSRNKMGSTQGKWSGTRKQTRCRVQHELKNTVESFFDRDDNSRMQPGKGDSKLASGERKQTRVLTDYLSNLHEKFLSENPTVTISRATFCRMRPVHVLTARFISRSSCLCTKHQNMALLLKALKKAGINVSANPEVFIKDGTFDEKVLSDKLPDMTTYGQWKRVEVVEKERKKSVMRIVDTEADKNTFIQFFKDQREEFTDHVHRVREQYQQIRCLKENLPKNEALIQMDFAENYSCKSLDEIQSAYWNKTSVTLHPVVWYYRDETDNVAHRSLVVVSDEQSHSVTTVHAILQKIVPEVKAVLPQLKRIHYWTDGPTSQYRNKQIFYTVANHMEIFGTDARWNYFEVGHGKGPCDGLGGTTKRMADAAVNSGKDTIQDAQDFYRWAQSSSMKGVKFAFVSSDECKAAALELDRRSLKPLKGTFRVHAVVGLGNSRVAVRDLSCYCMYCLNSEMCDTWRKESVQKQEKKRPSTSSNTVDKDLTATERPSDNNRLEISPSPTRSRHVEMKAGDFVAAVYQENWYIGKVLEVDEADQETEISFLEKKRQLFQWPSRKDVIWVPIANILCEIGEPQATGKSKRMLKLKDDDSELIKSLYQK